MDKKDLSLLKYYKEGNELCGFESDRPWVELVQNRFLDGDLELTQKGRDFIKNYDNWDNVDIYINPTKITIKP